MSNQSRIGDWGLSATGLKFYPLDLRDEEITINDIAASLSKLCRFGGHCKEFYSVAQHSVLVMQIVLNQTNDVTILRQALLHDATEAYCGDMIRPLKVNMPEFQEAERVIWQAICSRFDIPEDIDRRVDYADASLLLAEKRDLLVNSEFEWQFPQCKYPGIQSAEVSILPTTPKESELSFLSACHTLDIK